MDINALLILVSILLLVAIVIYNPAKTYGIPAALVFITFGFIVGNGQVLPAYKFPEATSIISQFALSIIIFTGGFHTPFSKIKPVLGEGLMLANLGVLSTAVLLGVFVSWVTPLNLMEGLLLGAVVSSTDAAATFSILESKKMKLKHQSDKALEFESATNDPMALILTLVLCNMLIEGGGFNLVTNLIFFFKQLIIGAIVAFGVGYLIKQLFKIVQFKEETLKPIFILALLLGTTLGAEKIGGNLLVTSYVLGVFLGNTEFKYKKSSQKVFESFTWLAQALMFILLGLEIFPAKVLEALSISLVPVFFLFFLARPLSVFASYLPFRQPIRKQLFVSWVGIKGATPIVFALVPLTMGVPNSELIFNMVVVFVVISMLLHGLSLEWVARRLRITE